MIFVPANIEKIFGKSDRSYNLIIHRRELQKESGYLRVVSRYSTKWVARDSNSGPIG